MDPNLSPSFLGAAAGGSADPDGIDDAFELIAEVNERVKTGVWVGDCFIYNTASWRLNYCVGGEVRACARACLQIEACAQAERLSGFC